MKPDLLVLDGDGDIIFSTPPRRQTLFLLAMIELGIRLGKPVFLVIRDLGLPADRKKRRDALSCQEAVCAVPSARIARSQSLLSYVKEEIPEAEFLHGFLIRSFAWFPYIRRRELESLPRNGHFLLPDPEKDKILGQARFFRTLYLHRRRSTCRKSIR